MVQHVHPNARKSRRARPELVHRIRGNVDQLEGVGVLLPFHLFYVPSVQWAHFARFSFEIPSFIPVTDSPVDTNWLNKYSVIITHPLNVFGGKKTKWFAQTCSQYRCHEATAGFRPSFSRVFRRIQPWYSKTASLVVSRSPFLSLPVTAARITSALLGECNSPPDFSSITESSSRWRDWWWLIVESLHRSPLEVIKPLAFDPPYPELIPVVDPFPWPNTPTWAFVLKMLRRDIEGLMDECWSILVFANIVQFQLTINHGIIEIWFTPSDRDLIPKDAKMYKYSLS